MHRALPAAFFEWLWLRRAAAFAKRLGSAARHLVAHERRFKEDLAWSRLGPNWTEGAEGTGGPIIGNRRFP